MKKINFTKIPIRLALMLSFGVFYLTGVQAQDPCIDATVVGTPLPQDIVDDGCVDVGPDTTEITISVAGVPADLNVEVFELELGMNHTWFSDLDIYFTSPSGVTVTVSSDNGTGADLESTSPIRIFDDAATPITSIGFFEDVCFGNGICEYSPEQPFADFGITNSSELNGDWILQICDDAGGDVGDIQLAQVNVQLCPPPVCEVTCPTDVTIDLDPGACSAQYTYAPILDGNTDECVLAPAPLECFTGPFALDAIDYGQNIENFLACDLIPGLTGCDVCVTNDDPCNLFLQSIFPNDDSQGSCGTLGFFATMYQWTVPSDGTLSFDWDYETEDFSAFFDRLAYSVGTDWSVTVASPANLDALTVDISDPAGANTQSGTASIDLQAGDVFSIMVFATDAIGGTAMCNLTNITFGEAGAVLVVNEGPAPGEEFPIGDTDVNFDVITTLGDTTNCEFTVTVVEFQNPTSTLACNDNVQVSLGEACDAFVSTDMILEGGPYSCYDDYLVSIEGYGSNFGGMMIDGDAVGQVLTVTVTDTTTGNSCWGTITVEDKIPPVLTNCDTLVVPCGFDLTPATTPPSSGSISLEEEPNLPIGPGFGVVTEVPFQVDAPFGTVITDVNVGLNLTHTWSSDLDVSLIGPDGTEIVLANDVCGTADNWENVLFDDDAPGFMCNGAPPPALTGPQTPQQPLADLNGVFASGTYLLRITDDAGGDGGTLLNASLFVAYEEFQITEPDVIENCELESLTYEDEEVGDECEGAAVIRTWTATDASGNTGTCEQVIIIEPLTLDQVVCPENYEGECNDSTDPSNTGFVTVSGVPITGGSVCNIFADFWDKPLTACGNGTKLIRTWTILDWCTQETFECVQIIKLDAAGPTLLCPEDQTVGSDPWNCLADVNLTPPAIGEECPGSVFTLVPTSSQGTIIDFGNGFYRVEDIPLGETVITWTAEDECGNSSTCEYSIFVIDDVPPVPLCDEFTVVSLTTDGSIQQGLTKVPAYVFDSGSYDNCSDVTFTARRMDSCIDFDWTTGGACVDDIPNGLVTSTDRGTARRPCVPFACCDVGAGPIMVILFVEDAAGNENTCMVEVEVQDKLAPFIVCPPNVTVSCDFWFDVAETNGFVDPSEDVLTPVFGDVLDAFDNVDADRQDIIIDDPGNDQLPQPFNWGRDGWADDNCDVDITVRVQIFDDCSGEDLPSGAPAGAVRVIRRTFSARDAQGNNNVCNQFIYVVDFDPFYISDDNCFNEDRNDGVIWPCDELYDFCPQGGLPVNYPTIFDDNCSLIGVTFEDTRFDFVQDACYKILREWTVIDWCQYDSQEGTGIWYYTQEIKVIDDEPTAILGCYPEPQIASVLTTNMEVTLPANNQVFLGEDNPASTSCSVHVRDTLRLSEFCSGEVTYDVKVYPFNGSDFLQIHEKRTVEIDTNGFADAILDTRTSDILAVRLNGLPYNSRFCSNWPLPGGDKDYHRVLWTVEDGCGNINTCSYLLRLEDEKAPSPVCVGLSSVVMPSSGEVTIWASDFEASSFDDCTPNADLLFSFSGENYEPSRSFDCAALEANGSPQFIVEIWVADQGNDKDCDGFRPPNQNDGITDGIEWEERNKDFCTTFIVIDDNEGVCGTGGSAGGAIETEELEPVELVTVDLVDKDGNVVSTFTTDKDGVYHFVNPLFDWTMNPVREDDPTNGVTTLDLVNIQKHLLGIEALETPYKIIAADANNSESVSAIDLVELRKLILGLYTELPNNSSWRFVDGQYVFPDAENPWGFPEVLDVSGLSMGYDFVGVKVGDVNGTVAANANSIVTRSTKGALTLEATDKAVVAGEEVAIAITSADFNNILGYQFTLRTEGLELTNVEAGAIDMSTENVGVHNTSITASWFRVEPATVDADEVLFTLSFTATQGGNLSEMLSIGSRITAAEAYNGNEELLDLGLTFRTDNVTAAGKDFALFQNAPNPFNGETVISFTLPEAMSATLTVFDVTGKVAYQLDGDYAAGFNQVTISKAQLQAAGVMYYRLDADNFTATKKMVVIE